jgi:uncharacterized protein (DUF983 family)
MVILGQMIVSNLVMIAMNYTSEEWAQVVIAIISPDY